MAWSRVWVIACAALAAGAAPPAAPLYAPSAAPTYPIDLPTALRLAGANNPTANVARARVQQAVAAVDRTRVMWLPTLSFGPSVFYHDGLDQSRSGNVVSVSRGNYTLGIGPSLRVNVADALYFPLAARRGLRAETSRSQTVTNNVQLDVAVAYFDMLEAHGLLAVNADTLDKAEQVLKAATAGATAGLNRTAADANRAATEVSIRRQEQVVLQGRGAAVAARLGQLLGLDAEAELTPYDRAVVPVVMVPAGTTLPQMIRTGLAARPEIMAVGAELQASETLVKHAKATPLLPRVQADFVGGGFAAGVNATFTQPRGYFNTGAALVWDLDNLGAGNAAAIRGRQAAQTAATFRVREVQVMVVAEIKAAVAQAGARFEALESAQVAVREATEMFRKIRDTSFGVAGPDRKIDVREGLTALQALNLARVQYLQQVVEFNRAQFRLFTAIGQPAVCGLDAATTQALDVPVLPQPAAASQPLPAPRPVAEVSTPLADRYFPRVILLPRE